MMMLCSSMILVSGRKRPGHRTVFCYEPFWQRTTDIQMIWDCQPFHTIHHDQTKTFPTISVQSNGLITSYVATLLCGAITESWRWKHRVFKAASNCRLLCLIQFFVAGSIAFAKTFFKSTTLRQKWLQTPFENLNPYSSRSQIRWRDGQNT